MSSRILGPGKSKKHREESHARLLAFFLMKSHGTNGPQSEALDVCPQSIVAKESRELELLHLLQSAAVMKHNSDFCLREHKRLLIDGHILRRMFTKCPQGLQRVHRQDFAILDGSAWPKIFQLLCARSQILRDLVLLHL